MLDSSRGFKFNDSSIKHTSHTEAHGKLSRQNSKTSLHGIIYFIFFLNLPIKLNFYL